MNGSQKIRRKNPESVLNAKALIGIGQGKKVDDFVQ